MHKAAEGSTFNEIIEHGFGGPPIPPDGDDGGHGGGGGGEGGHLVNALLALALVLVPIGVFVITYLTNVHH